MTAHRPPHTDRETTRIVRSWLDEGTTRLPDRVLDAVLDAVPSTPQRRAWWPAGRLATSNAMRVAIAAAAVLVGAFVVMEILPGTGSGPGGQAAATATPIPTQAPTATPASTQAPAPTVAPGPTSETGELLIPAGPYAGRVLEPSHTVQMDMPADWIEHFNDPDGTWASRNDRHTYLVFGTPDVVRQDPCKEGPLDPPLGPTVDDLADYIAGQAALDVVAPIPATLGGYQGMYLEVTVPMDLPCHNQSYHQLGDEMPYVIELGEAHRIWILDVDGTRLVVDAFAVPSRTDADLAELKAITDSVVITPGAPSPAP